LRKLRFVLQGIGQVKIGCAELCSAQRKIPARLRRGWLLLGEPASKASWPNPSHAVTREIEF
jgi:hypothetical protein